MDESLHTIDIENDRRRQRAHTLFDTVSVHFKPSDVSQPDATRAFSGCFVEQVREVRGSLSVRGRLADLIVTARSLFAANIDHPLMLEVALRETGRPVLICSSSTNETSGRRIAVAWNGSAEASRAVAMTLDFLVAAEEVVVITINEADTFEPSAENLVDFLRWHGVGASSITLDGTAISAGDMLLAQIEESAADMLVVGAYTRDRIRRLIFGSVTGAVLSRATLPVLMVD